MLRSLGGIVARKRKNDRGDEAKRSEGRRGGRIRAATRKWKSPNPEGAPVPAGHFVKLRDETIFEERRTYARRLAFNPRRA